MKPLGSITFDTSEIRTDEAVIFVKTFRDNGDNLEESLLQLHYFDDIICLMKTQIIGSRRTAKGTLRKNTSLTDYINKRTDMLIEDLEIINEKSKV